MSNAEENWEDSGTSAGAVVQPQQVLAELPDIKLFNKWSCDDVQVSDMSLQVSNNLGYGGYHWPLLK